MTVDFFPWQPWLFKEDMTIVFCFFPFRFSKMGFGLATPCRLLRSNLDSSLPNDFKRVLSVFMIYMELGQKPLAILVRFLRFWHIAIIVSMTFLTYIYIFNLKKSAGSLSAGAFKHRNHGWVCQNGVDGPASVKASWPWLGNSTKLRRIFWMFSWENHGISNIIHILSILNL